MVVGRSSLAGPIIPEKADGLAADRSLVTSSAVGSGGVGKEV